MQAPKEKPKVRARSEEELSKPYVQKWLRQTVFSDRAYRKMAHAMGDDVRTRTNNNLAKHKEKIGPLSDQEQKVFNFTLNLLKRFSERKQIYLLHCGNRDKIRETGTILSYDELKRRDIKFLSSTFEIDQEFGNSDFVFFRIQFGLRHMAWRLENLDIMHNMGLDKCMILKTNQIPSASFFTHKDWWDLAGFDNFKELCLDISFYEQDSILEAIAWNFMDVYRNRSDAKKRASLQESMKDHDNDYPEFVRYLNLVLDKAELKIPDQVCLAEFEKNSPSLK